MSTQLKRKVFVYLALVSFLVVGGAVLTVAPDADAGCVCTGGYHYADDLKPCTAAGTNCAVCDCWAK